MFEAHPRVSVVIPYYNSSWSISRTIQSVINQSFRDFEIILVDDGSTEDARTAIAFDYENLRIVRQANRGLAGARNRGIAESGAEYVAPLDADDLWHPHYLAELVSALDKTPTAPFAYCDSYRIDEEDILIPDRRLTAIPSHDFAGLISLNSVGSGSAAVFRRASLVKVGGYDETLKERAAQGAEDWKLLVTLAYDGMPVFVPRKLMAYRLTKGGMSQARPNRQLAAIDAVLNDLRRDYPSLPRPLLRDARTMMVAWLLPAFLRRRMWRSAAREATRAYLLNPLWWRNRNLWLVHAARLRLALATLAGVGQERTPLADLQEQGVRPFRFLDG